MLTIHRYPLEWGPTELVLPVGFTVLKVGVIKNEPYLWIKLDTSIKTTIKKVFRIIITGGPLGHPSWEQFTYLDTLIARNGQLEGHLLMSDEDYLPASD